MSLETWSCLFCNYFIIYFWIVRASKAIFELSCYHWMNICYFFLQGRKCWYQIKGIDKFLMQVFQLHKIISASGTYMKVSCIFFFGEKFFIDLV